VVGQRDRARRVHGLVEREPGAIMKPHEDAVIHLADVYAQCAEVELAAGHGFVGHVAILVTLLPNLIL
jgi:hypothetical protein